MRRSGKAAPSRAPASQFRKICFDVLSATPLTHVVDDFENKRHGFREEAMNAKLFLTINAVIAVLYGLAFVFIPTAMLSVYGAPPQPHAALNLQFFGSALIMIGVIAWFAREFHDWDAIRGVLIALVIGDVVGGGVNLLGTLQGLLNGMAWTSTLVYLLLLIGAVYCLLTAPEASGTTAKAAR